MSTVSYAFDAKFDVDVPLLIVGAGAAGLCAALAAKEAGIEPLVIERDAVPAGSTALSAGLIPAAGTRFQRAKGIIDSPQLFAADIARKAKGEADAAVVDAVAHGAGALVESLADRYGLPTRTGLELINRLRHAAETRDISIIPERIADGLLAKPDGRIRGVEILRGDGGRERIGCAALILACSGFGGNRELVRRFIPEMGGALYFGHPGNRGDAVMWGEALGAKLSHLGAYQGHGSVATPHNILITWATIMQGGIQINRDGLRFCDETQGYSEQAAEVLRQPGAIAWSIFDARIAAVARQFEDFRDAERAGAVLSRPTVEDLAGAMRVPAAVFAAEWTDVESLKAKRGQDRYGRQFAPEQLCVAPFHAVKVTGALFHTQGGLAIDGVGRVRREDGALFPNLFAAGGAAAGVSGASAAGYLSGNGLLTATVLGRLAGQAAARLCLERLSSDLS